jgi:RNA polymerase sigma-70 factor, ECF subfamily
VSTDGLATWPVIADGASVVGGAPATAGSDLRRQTFERVIPALRPELYRYAFWLSRDPTVADDVVQDALVRAWRSFDSLKDRGAIKHWLLTIVRREHARIYERKRLPSSDIDELSAGEQFSISTEDDTDLADLRGAIFSLEPEYREPLVLQVLMGYSADEIGDIMSITPGAVLTRVCRARKQLAARFALPETPSRHDGQHAASPELAR